MTLVCITNERIPGIRPCTHRDVHTVSCDGWAYRADGFGNEYATGKECTGCAPREARQGLLCWTCWEQVEAELARWDAFAGLLRATEGRAVQRDNAGVRATVEGHVNLTGTTLAINEVESYLRSGAGLTALMWVSSEQGARDAVLFAKTAAAAHRTHEVEERARKAKRVRCPDCGQVSLVRNAPDMEGAPVTVKCQTDGCGKTIREGDTDIWGDDKVTVIANIEARRTA